MAVVNIDGEGLLFNPTNLFYPISYQATGNSTLDASGESITAIGRLHLSDKGSGKALGGATLWFRNGSSTFANAGSTFRVGIQDVDLSTGIEDGTFDVYKDFTGGGGVLLSNTWQGHILDTGSKSVSHGDLIAISFEFITRAGTDSILIQSPTTTVMPGRGFPYATLDTGAGPAKQFASGPPIALIVFSDGEIGRIDHTWSFTDPDQGTINTTTQAGLYFIAPFTGTINKLVVCPIDSVGSTDVVVLSIWQDPLGTPSTIYQETLDSDVYSTSGSFSAKFSAFLLPTPVSITAGEDYVISLHTTSGIVNYGFVNLGTGNSGMRKITALKEDWARATRTIPSSGAFTILDTSLPAFGFYMDSIDIGSGGGATAYTFG